MGRKTKREEDPKPQDSEDSEDELCRRIANMQCLENHHYACDNCRRTYTGSHSFTKIWMGFEPDRCVWYCRVCIIQYYDPQSSMWKGPMTPPMAASASSHAAAAATACASDNACAAACAADWLGPDPDGVNQPVPDQQDDDLKDDSEVKDGEPESEPDKDKDKKP